MSIEWVSRDQFVPEALKQIESTDIVLDIGAGIRNVEWASGRFHILCEPYSEYIQVLQEKFRNNRRVAIAQNKGLEFLETVPDSAVDTVLVVDVIEHLEKDEGVQLLRECERVARKQIVVFTPLGFMPQDYQDNDIDGWGLKGGFWQRHLSGWLPEDFDASWNILACRDFHLVNGKGEPFDPPFGAFWAFKMINPVKLVSEHIVGTLIQNHALLVDDYLDLKEVHMRLEERRIALEERHVGLEERHIALEERYVGLEERHIALEERYVGLEERHIALEERYVGLEEHFILLEQKVAALEQKHFTVEENYTLLEERSSTLAQRITPLEEQVGVLKALIDKLRNLRIIRLFSKL